MAATSTIYEPIKTALLSRLQTQLGTNFLTYSRRFKMWEQLTTDLQSSGIKQPALYLFDGVGLGGGKVRYEQRGRGRPVVRILSLTIVVYAQLRGAGTSGGVDVLTSGGTIFGPLVEAIEATFLPEVGDGPGGTLTLGGLVSHCWIEGEGVWITPDIDPGGQGMFTIPVSIMIP